MKTKNAAKPDMNQYKKRSQFGSICRRFAKSRTAMSGVGANKDLQGITADAMGNYRVYDWSWAE